MPLHRLSLLFLSALIVVSATADPPSSSRSWPNWMGPNHDGISAESGWSIDWSESGLETRWKREIGIGFSSVSIADGRLFTMGHSDGNETVFCLNVDNGDTIWSHSYPSKIVANLYEGGPGCTPTIDGKHVYALGKEGQLFCFEAKNGEILWQREMQKDLGVGLPEWGFNSSPYILDDQLVVQGGRVVSYHKQTGDLNWKTDRHTPGYGSAALFDHGDQQLIATLDSDAVRLVDANDGKQFDAFPWPSPFRTNSTTPIVHDDTIFVSSAYQVGCGLFRIVDSKLELVYDNRDMKNHFNNSILHDGYLYGFDGNSNFARTLYLVCMDYKTGEVAWKQTGLGCGSLMVADNKLVILSEDGELVIAKATSKEYDELARTRLFEGRCWTVPVLLGGHIYARNAKGDLTATKLPTE